MAAYIFRRLLLIVPTLFGILLVNFVLIQFVPGGPIEQIIAEIEEGANALDSVTGGSGDPVAGSGEDGYQGGRGLPEDFIKDLFTTGTVQLGRAFIQESVLSSEHALHVLDYERASEVIESARDIGIGLCYCRHKREHQGTACDAEMDICMTFNSVASSLPPTAAN